MPFFIILALYAVILVTFVFLYAFIIYHLVKYSINASLNKILLPFFILVSTVLLFSNIVLFFSINWNGVFSQLLNFG